MIMSRLVVLSVIILLSGNVYSLSTKDINEKDAFDALKELIIAGDAKLAALEAEFKERQKANELEISNLKLKIEHLESDFKFKELAMQEEINILRIAIKPETDDDSSKQQENRQVKDVRRNVSSNQKQGIIRNGRAFPETEVAFYATHNAGQVHHLGKDQVIPFQLMVTNIGHAFSNYTSSFVAPVDGTYVFHATIMAIDAANGAHFRAHFDVNGSKYSVFFTTSYDQSSQMLVIDLKAGHTVTIRNDYPDFGFFGQHHTTFSGFLLYEHSSTGAIVGK